MKVDLINHLLSMGSTILRITENEANSEYSYFDVTVFREASPNSSEPISHNYVEGVEITDWLAAHSNMALRDNFVKAYQSFLEKEDTEVVRMTFSPSMKWKKYSKYKKN